MILIYHSYIIAHSAVDELATFPGITFHIEGITIGIIDSSFGLSAESLLSFITSLTALSSKFDP